MKYFCKTWSYFSSLIIVLTFSLFVLGPSVVQASVCGDITSPRTCNESCSPPKGANKDEFRCRWNYNTQSCGESAKICVTSGGGGGVVGGSGCTKINNKCYNCQVEKGPANHYTCSYLPINNAGCPNSYQTGIVTKSYLGILNAGTQQFCFDGGPEACGSEQIDWKGGFISRIGPEACGSPTKIPTIGLTRTPTPTKTPTPTPKVSLTPTPTFVPLICQEMKVFLNGIRITDLSKIKYGDTVTYKAYANTSGRSVKSMTFQYLVSGIVIERVVAPATLTNGVWSATYKHTINRYGKHRVRVIAVTPQ